MSGRPEIAHEDRLLSAAEVATLLGVSPLTLVKWRRERRGPPYFRLSGIRVRYRLTAVRQWIAAQTIN